MTRSTGSALLRRVGVRFTFMVLLSLSTTAAGQSTDVQAAENVEVDSADGGETSPRVSWQEAQVQLEDTPWSAAAQFNAGLVAAHEDRIGYAVLHLERARYLRPFESTIRKTLSLVRQQAQRERMESYEGEELTRGEPAALSLWRMSNAFPHRLWVYVGGGALWLAALLVLLRWRLAVGVKRDIVSSVAGLMTVLGLLCLSAWLVALITARSLTPAVVVGESPTYRHAPDELSGELSDGEIYEGAVVIIHGRSGGWAEIEIAEGRHVWVEPAQLREIRDF